MPALTGTQRRYLRSLGHNLTPVVTVGSGGASPGLVNQIQLQLHAHELIKVKVLEGTRPEMRSLGATLADETNSELAQVLGRTLLLYRAREENPTIDLPSGRGDQG